MAEQVDRDDFLPVAVPIMRQDRQRDHPRAERTLERAERLEIVHDNPPDQNAPVTSTFTSPYLHDLINEDCTCTATAIRSGGTKLRGCQRIVERCSNFPEEVSYQHPRTGRTPLHIAAMKNACFHVFEAITETHLSISYSRDFIHAVWILTRHMP
jgi:hypothetical protein